MVDQSFDIGIKTVRPEERVSIEKVAIFSSSVFACPLTFDMLRSDIERKRSELIIARHEGHLVGFSLTKLAKRSRAISHIAVVERFRRRGVGRDLINANWLSCSKNNVTKLLMMVAETDLATQLFCKKTQFRCVKTHHGYLETTGEDVYQFELPVRSYRPKTT